MLVTVITVVLNNKDGLSRTVESILSQTYRNLESVIIDGGSSDGTVDVILQHKAKIGYWVSEQDSGVYNAMNKGVLKANGDYLIFLNAGDYFCSSSAIARLIEQANGEDLIFGDILYKNGFDHLLKTYPDRLDFSFFVESTLPHPCTLIKKRLFVECAGYDETLPICADWAFFLKAISQHNSSYKHVSEPVSCFELGGISSDVAKVKREKVQHLKKNYSFFYDTYCNLKVYEKRILSLKKSRTFRLLLRLLPELKKTIYD